MGQFRSTELVENMRQKDDAAYQELLLSVRLGNLNEKQALMLESRIPKRSDGKRLLTSSVEIAKYLMALLEKDPGTISLVPTVQAMNEINHHCLSFVEGEKRTIVAEDGEEK